MSDGERDRRQTPTPHQQVIRLFGGARKCARHLGISPRTVENWVNSGYIPSQRLQGVYDCAKKNGLNITHSSFFDPEDYPPLKPLQGAPRRLF